MMKSNSMLLTLAILILTSCNAPASIPLTDTPRPTLPPTFTPVPPTQTPVQLTLRVKEEKVNCRYGPGLVYAFVNEMEKGQSARVIGRNDEFTWWYIRDPGNPKGTCWVSADVTEITGEASRLQALPPPAVEVTGIRLKLQPERLFVQCTQFPQTIFFEAEVTANGPIIAVWRLESSAGYISSENDLIFQEAGTQTINGYHQIPKAGDYIIQIQILKPNNVAQQINFPANCAP